MLVMRRAEKEDEQRIHTFVKKAKVQNPPENLEDIIFVENEQTDIIAMIAIETYDTVGLLRSFVVMAQDWNAEKTLRFFKTVFTSAKQKQLHALYLFTAGHAEFLSALGFKEIKREELPESIKNSKYVKHADQVVAMCCSLES